VAAAATLPLAASALAADGQPPLAWSVAPADADGPDGRHWFELAVEPGGSVEERLAVTNQSDQEAIFAIQAADGYFTEAGRFNMLDRPEDSVDAGTWIDVRESVTVGPHETVVVPFTVTVPAAAEPGDHPAGIAAALLTSKVSDDGTAQVGVVSRFGLRVMTRVNGELRPGLEISGLDAGYRMTWNPLAPGRLDVGFDLVNVGNARLTVTGAVRVGGGNTAWPDSDGPRIELLPGETRHVEAQVRRVWPVFAVRARVEAAPDVIALDGVAPPKIGQLEASTRVAAIPWAQLAALAGVALITAAGLAGRRRSKRRLADLLDRARADERDRLSGPASGRGDGLRLLAISGGEWAAGVAGMLACLAAVGAPMAATAEDGVDVVVTITPRAAPTASSPRPTSSGNSPTDAPTTAPASAGESAGPGPSQTARTGFSPGIAAVVALGLAGGGAALLATRRKLESNHGP
jgi:hypothetical protein